ncbi:MAG: hypothetical protein K0S47_272 [Herbinix sp.]|nr:hypothetical protein [Herbinix sp.]
MGLETKKIDDCLLKVKEEWLGCADTFPNIMKETTKEDKSKNEAYLQLVSKQFQKQFDSYPHFYFGRKKWRKETLSLLNDILYQETVLGIHEYMDQVKIDHLQQELMEFLRHVRTFAPELSLEEIGQAIRNYIVYTMFKEISQKNAGFHIGCFGYSMLYPFTDNYIDNHMLSSQDKMRYNRLIRDKIEGKETHTKTIHEQKTCALLQDIESVYPRNHHSDIYMLLLLMLDAQEHSLLQQKKNIMLSGDERLHISVQKGGISVLIDRFFVDKEITEDELYFYLAFGFFLQLADDLQDIKEDNLQGYQTIFTLHLTIEQTEKTVNRMFHFIYKIMKEFHSENDPFQYFILLNCYQLICSSVIGSKEFFSEQYRKELEKYLPVSYSFYETTHMEPLIKKTEKKYLKILDDILFT